MATTANTTGINVTGIQKIKEALTLYRKTVAEKCNIQASAKILDNAIRGEVSQKSLETMAAAIDTKMKSYINQLDQYDELLNQIQTSYAKNDAENQTFDAFTKQLSE